MKAKILIVDDEPMTRNTLARLLGDRYECRTASDGDAALADLDAHPDTDLVLTDYKMPGMNGLELLKKAKERIPTLGGVVLTAFGEVDLAVEAMKSGADDFLQKPITDIGAAELRIANVLKTTSLAREVAELKTRLAEKRGLAAFTGSSPAMERVYRIIRQAAPSTASVLIEGPSGTGKELVARALHDISPRSKGPFVAVECAALSSTLLESELFGYEPNAFTGASAKGKTGRFEAANGGTLFLDEIGEIDASVQVKLLRVLESRTIQRVGGNADIPVDFRLVTATNRDLAALVAAGTFREDLYYRLHVIDIAVPALRDRPGDIALLVTRFLREYSAANGNRVTGIEPDALHALEEYAWPGNVRQLRNVIERMVVLAGGERLQLSDLPPEITAAPSPRASGVPTASSTEISTPRASAVPAASHPEIPVPATNESLAEVEKRQILAAIGAARGNKTRAADMLGISRRTLHRKLKEWNSTASN